MANELSRERIEELERLLEASGTGDVNDDAAYASGALGALPSLLAMAKRLVELESALEMLERNSGRERGFWEPANLLEAARSLGWTPDAGRGGK
jgi:hypothetical protein